MMLARVIWLILLSLLGIVILSPHFLKTVTACPEQVPTGHTEGFGEPTCHKCHFDQVLNDPDGSLVIEGLPKIYIPGERYLIIINLKKSDIQKGGFQLTARFKERDRMGQQAGSLRSMDERTEVIQGDSNKI